MPLRKLQMGSAPLKNKKISVYKKPLEINVIRFTNARDILECSFAS